MRLDKIDALLPQLHSNPSPEKRAVVLLQLFDFSTKHVLLSAEALRKMLDTHKFTRMCAQQFAVNPDCVLVGDITAAVAALTRLCLHLSSHAS